MIILTDRDPDMHTFVQSVKEKISRDLSSADDETKALLSKCLYTYALTVHNEDGELEKKVALKNEIEAELNRIKTASTVKTLQKRFKETGELKAFFLSQLEALKAVEAEDMDVEINKAKGKKTIEQGDMGDSDEEEGSDDEEEGSDDDEEDEEALRKAMEEEIKKKKLEKQQTKQQKKKSKK